MVLLYTVINGYNTSEEVLLSFMSRGICALTDSVPSSYPLQASITKINDQKVWCANGAIQNEKPFSLTSNLSEEPNLVATSPVQQKKISPEKISVVVVGDSHGRHLARLLQEKSNNAVAVKEMIQPGAKLQQVISAFSLLNVTAKDNIVFTAGANDIYSGESFNIFRNLKKSILKLKPARVLLCSIPFRVDLPLFHGINEEIMKVNVFLHEISCTMNNVEFIDFGLYSSRYFALSGIHLNIYGKRIVASKIIKALPLRRASITPSSSSLQEICLLEMDMKQVIEKFQKDSTTAFAHCISADTSMSAGVAKIFKAKFGEPRLSDFESDHLTCQEMNNRATVYGLVTKNEYWMKPRTEKYDKCFEELGQDFKKKKLRRLFCSPMGCVRDKIPVEHFVSKLKDFQKITGATISIVTCDEQARGQLYNDLTYTQFVQKLRGLLPLQSTPEVQPSPPSQPNSIFCSTPSALHTSESKITPASPSAPAPEPRTPALPRTLPRSFHPPDLEPRPSLSPGSFHGFYSSTVDEVVVNSFLDQ